MMVNVGTIASAMVISLLVDYDTIQDNRPTCFYTSLWDNRCRYGIVSIRLRGPRSGYLFGSALAEGQELVLFIRRRANSTLAFRSIDEGGRLCEHIEWRAMRMQRRQVAKCWWLGCFGDAATGDGNA